LVQVKAVRKEEQRVAFLICQEGNKWMPNDVPVDIVRGAMRRQFRSAELDILERAVRRIDRQLEKKWWKLW
jgi:hypothetical protein